MQPFAMYDVRRHTCYTWCPDRVGMWKGRGGLRRYKEVHLGHLGRCRARTFTASKADKRHSCRAEPVCRVELALPKSPAPVAREFRAGFFASFCAHCYRRLLVSPRIIPASRLSALFTSSISSALLLRHISSLFPFDTPLAIAGSSGSLCLVDTTPNSLPRASR